jgi:anthranilate phosphoribosyltransferase
MSHPFPNAIYNLIRGKNLSQAESKKLMMMILDGQATDAQISAWLVALRMKGETFDEVAGAVKAVNSKTRPIKTKIKDVVDTSGTGGDNLSTFNVSTAAALVAAGAGVNIAKLCDQAVSGKCGSSDVLLSLGVNLDLAPDDLSRCLGEIGLVFLWAPKLRMADRYAVGPRKEIGVRTIFNLLNPLTNPAGVKRHLLGVYDRGLLRLMVEALKALGSVQVMAVHGCEGMDEISISGPTIICELVDENIYEYMIRPENFGMEASPVPTVQIKSVNDSKRVILDVLQGIPSAVLNIVLLNAGAAIKVSGLVGSIWEGIQKARQSVESGAALDKLKKLVEFTNRVNLASE